MTTGSAVVPKFSTWSATDHSVLIEYSPVVLDEIRMTAVEGYHRVPHGGVETGGILFGARTKNGVRIKAWRPIECEYANGPSFLLSERDEAAFAETLKSWPSDPELAAMEPVGWYRAHTRSEILLAASDVAFFDRYFSQPWQVALIVRPASFNPTRAGFFFREPDGSLRTGSSYHEFVVAPLAGSIPRRGEPRPDPLPEPVPVETAGIPVPPPAPEPPREAPEALPSQAEPAAPRVFLPRPLPLSPPRSGDQWNWYGVGAAALLLAVLGFWLLKPSHKTLSLSTTDLAGHLRIAWDPAARPLEHARGAYIEIDDRGAKTQMNLAPTDLRLGNVSYLRQSGDVAVTMTVDVPGSPPVVEVTRFLKPGQTREPQTAKSTPQPAAAQPRPVPKTAPVQTPPVQTPPVQTARVEAKKTGPEAPALPPAPASRRVVAFRAPAARQPSSPPSLTVAPPPSISNVPAASPATPLNSVVGSVSAPPPPPVAAPAPAPARPSTSTKPASGRIIWTGKFPKNGKLVLEGNRASFGSMSGSLPPGPARVSAYPGDLTPGGITVFTGDPKYSAPTTEPAKADNGWNATTYTWDAKRAAGVRILEQPTPQNGYKLVLQSDSTKPSVLMLEWHAAP